MAKPYYNPAVAGATEDLNILALARLEMIGVHGAPKSFFITADMPLAFRQDESRCRIGCIYRGGSAFPEYAM